MKYLKSFEKHKKGELANFINKVKKAKEFATKAHEDQFRNGGAPYIIHPDSVAKIVYDVKKSKNIADLIAAAYLHDTIEDQPDKVDLETIKEEFGELVMSLVDELTSDEEKLAISGKEEYLIDKMLSMSSWALVIKLADRLHNLDDFEEIMSGTNEKRKRWVNKYAHQTKHIIEELEWYRDLSDTQKELVRRIKDKLKLVIEI